MHQNAGFVYHRKVKRAPIFEERQVEQLVVNGEVVVQRILVWCLWRSFAILLRAYTRLLCLLVRGAVEDVGEGCWVRKCGKV